MRKLRCPPAEPAYPLTPQMSQFDVNDIRTLPFSDLDEYARSWYGVFVAGRYRRSVTRVFLAQRFALGFVEVVDGLDVVLRVVMCYLGVKAMASVGEGVSMSSIFMVGACHIYGLAKGYR